MADITDLLRTAQGVTSQYQSNEPISEGFISDLAGGAFEAARAGTADITRILHKVTEAMTNAAGSEGAKTDRSQVFKKLTEEIEPKDFQDQATLTRKIGRVFGGLLVAVPKYAGAMAALGPIGLGAATSIPAFAGVDAATAWGRDAPPEEIVKAGLQGAAFGTLLGPVGSKLARWPRIGAVGGGATALAAAEGETRPEDLAITGLTMAVLSAGGRLPRDLQTKLNKLGYPNEAIKKLSIKDARNIARTNSKFVAPEPIITTTETKAELQPTQDYSSPYANTLMAQMETLKNSEVVYDKMLLGRKFTDEQIASMPITTKLSIVNSGHNVDTIKVEPISGRITLTGKAPEITNIEGRIPGFGQTVEDMVIDSGKEANLINTVKNVTANVDTAIIPETQAIPAIQPKPIASKEIVNQLKWKFKIGPQDAKKVAMLLDERGIKIPSDATAFFENIPLLPKGNKLYDHIINFERKQALLKEKPELEAEKESKQLAKLTAKEEIKEAKKKGLPSEVSLEPETMIITVGEERVAINKYLKRVKSDPTMEAELKTLENLPDSEIRKFPIDSEIPAHLKDELFPTQKALEIGRKLSKAEAVKLWKQYKVMSVENLSQREKTLMALEKQQIKEQVEGYLGVTGTKSLTPEEIDSKLLGRKVTVKELTKEMATEEPTINIVASNVYKGERKTSAMGPNDEMIVAKSNGKDIGFLWISKEEGGFKVQKIEVDPKFRRQGIATQLMKEAEGKWGKSKGAVELQTPEGKAFTEGRLAKTPEEINREQLLGRASVLWPNRRADLARLSDTDLQRIVTENIFPERASITPSGKLMEMAVGDKSVADILKVAENEGTLFREAMEKESPRTQEGLLRAAADFMDIPYKTIAKLSAAEQQATINTYLQHADKNIVKAQKLGDVIEKGEIAATKAYNEIISKNPDTDVALSKLKRKYTEVKRKEAVARSNYDKGLIDRADLDLLTHDKTEILKAIETRRNTIKAKTAAPLKSGDSLFVSTLTKDDNGGIIIVKKVSDNIDEFQLLTKAGRSPIPGDGGLHVAGRVKVETLQGKPIKVEFPDLLDIAQQDFFKEQFKKSVQGYYEKQGFGLPEARGVKLLTGIDVDLLKEMTARLKQKTTDIYLGFVARRGANKGISKEEMPSIMKDIMDAEKLKLSEAEIAAMYAESMSQGITKIPEGFPMPAPTTKGAPAGISKGDVPMVKPTDILGQSMANANPDIKQVSERAVLNEIRKRHLKDKLVYGDDSRLKAIFKKINEQPNAKELKEELADSFIRDTVPTNPLLLEAKNDIRSFLDLFGDANNLRERGFFVNKYFPLIADMDNTYLKVKGMFANIDNNTAHDPMKNPRGLPQRYIEAGKSVLSDEEFLELKTIFARKKSWKELSNIEKNRIRYNVLQFEGVYDQWAFLPSDVMEKTNKKTFNPHLQERKGGQLLTYKHDAQEVLNQYIYTMINKESDRVFKQEVMPVLNKYPRADIRGSVRWYMEKQVKQALGTRTEGSKWLAQEVERLNNVIGQEVLNPNFPTALAGRLSGQVARGALGPDTALRNVMQSMQTLVNEGPGKFAKGLHSYLNYLKGKSDPEIKKMFDMLLGAEEYYEDVGPAAKTLRARLQKAETLPEKAGAFYNWLGDKALSPMRATEHFNKFLAFQTALNDAGARGLSFEKGIRLGLLKSMEMVPDLEIPSAYWEAFKSTIQSQYGYSKVMRNPLTRGPLAKVSTIFWSYPANTIQFIARGLTDGLKGGDMAKTTRFALYAGFQLSIAAAMAQLGLDVGAIFGVGLMPVKMLSVPWEVMKGAYQSQFGSTAADRSSGTDDFLNALGMVAVPQYRYGKKVLKTVIDIERGYKAAGTRELETMETSPFHAIMDLTGFPMIGSRETYDLAQELRDQSYEYSKSKQELVLRGIKAMEKGRADDVQKVFVDAKDKNVVLTYAELSKYYRIHKTKTYLQSNLERLPKHLRPAMQTKVKELEEELMPHRFGKAENVTGRSLWSSPSQYRQIEEEAE